MNTKRFSRENLVVENGLRFFSKEKEYILGGKIGDGAIGVVRKATRKKTGVTYAVKFLAPEFSYIEETSMDDIYARFKREGNRGLTLNQDNLVDIITYEDNENGENFLDDRSIVNPFIIMEYVKGRSLESYLRKFSREKPAFNINKQTLSIAYSIADALVYLHNLRIVHRDVKPANIYLSKTNDVDVPEIVKLGDFGIVKWGDYISTMLSGSLTMLGQKGLGTFKYMSPEQSLEPKKVSVRADMYSFGITLFELFTCQIFPSPYHVFQLSLQRYDRSGNTMSHLNDLGLGIIPGKYELLFSKIYDCFLTYPRSRPSSIDMRGYLTYLLS